jgi:hypothetical protein
MISEEVASMRGTWRLPNSSVVVQISISGEEIRIRATDRDDGEELRVEDIDVGSDKIAFTLVTPSTQWTVQKQIEPQDNGSIRCITTILDSWERIA